jgi:hypothetical protein
MVGCSHLIISGVLAEREELSMLELKNVTENAPTVKEFTHLTLTE